jgi:uroporphyrinogen decarboxylase
VNSIERVLAAVNFGTPDRTPVMPQIFGHAAVISGRSILEYVQNGTVAADCQLAALRQYGHDNVFAATDVCLEAEAIGATLRFAPDYYPAVAKPLLTAQSDIASLQVPDPRRAGRMPELLSMAGKLRQAVGDETLVVGMVQGPMTLALQLLGPEAALYFAADDSDRFETLLDYCADVAIRFGLAQMKAGAHLPLVFEPGGCPEVVPPGYFRELLAPRLSRIFRAFKKAGASVNWLHIAGRTLPILPMYAGVGVTLGNFDYCVDAQRLCDELPHPLCVDGNIRPLAFIEDEPEQIEAEARRLIQVFSRRGGFILSSGCEIPPESKPANVAALVCAAQSESCRPSTGPSRY